MAHEPYNGILYYRLRAALRMLGDNEEFERVNRFYTSFEESFKQLRPVYQEALADPTLGLAPHTELYQRLADLRERMGRPDEARPGIDWSFATTPTTRSAWQRSTG